MHDLIVRMGRVDDLYKSTILLDSEVLWAAMNTNYEVIIRTASGFLNQYPDARLIFERTDGNHLVKPWIAMPDEKELIRTNPQKYIAANQGYDRTIVVRDRLPERYKLKVRAGFDNLAESFGDNVYSRYRDDGKVECPACGRWLGTITEIQDSNSDEVLYELRCECPDAVKPYGVIAWGVQRVGSWLEISTLQLLRLSAKRYYFPRSWNPHGSWISSDDLMELYNQFTKEKANV